MARTENGKFKKWVKDHKNDIVQCVFVGALCSLGCVIGYYGGMKDSKASICRGLDWAHDNGYIKLVNPLTGLEVTFEESARLIQNHRLNG